MRARRLLAAMAAAPVALAAAAERIDRFAREYEPPAPGTYNLPILDEIGDHALVESGGRATTLHALKRGRLAVVAFVYFSCNEREGCPLALAVLRRLDERLGGDPELAGRVALITISFDPERDTPTQLAAIRRLHRPKTDWKFVTTRSARELEPVLADFDQTVAKLRDENGRWTGLLRHVLKVFVLDSENRVRNVYSAGLLDPELVLNDLKTVVRDPLSGSTWPAPRP